MGSIRLQYKVVLFCSVRGDIVQYLRSCTFSSSLRPQRLRKKPSRISTATAPHLEPAFSSVFPDSPLRNRSPSPSATARPPIPAPGNPASSLSPPPSPATAPPPTSPSAAPPSQPPSAAPPPGAATPSRLPPKPRTLAHRHRQRDLSRDFDGVHRPLAALVPQAACGAGRGGEGVEFNFEGACCSSG